MNVIFVLCLIALGAIFLLGLRSIIKRFMKWC